MNSTLNNILKIKMNLVEKEILITLFNNQSMTNIQLFKFFNHRIKIENIDKAITKLLNKNYIIMNENKSTFNEELFIDEIGSIKQVTPNVYIDKSNAEPIVYTDEPVTYVDELETNDDIPAKVYTDEELLDDCSSIYVENNEVKIIDNIKPETIDIMDALTTPLSDDVLNSVDDMDDLLPGIEETSLSSTEDHINSVDEETIIEEIKPSVEPLNEFKPFQIDDTYNPKLLVFDLEKENHKKLINRSNDTLKMIYRCFEFTYKNRSYSNSEVIYDKLFNKVKFGNNDVVYSNDLVKVYNELKRVEVLYSLSNDNQYINETTRLTSDKILMELYNKVNEQIAATSENNTKEVAKLNKRLYYMALLITFISKYVEANPNDMFALVTYNRLRYSLDVEQNFPYLLGLAIQVINKLSDKIK